MNNVYWTKLFKEIGKQKPNYSKNKNIKTLQMNIYKCKAINI